MTPVHYGALGVIVVGGLCALMPARKPPPPRPLVQIDGPADVYEWKSKSGERVLRVRLPRKQGRPKGDWYLAEDAKYDA